MKPLFGRSLGVMLWLVLAASIGAVSSSSGLAQPVQQALPAVVALQVATPPTEEEPYPLPRAEFTRADYEAALAKWRSRGITRYEMLIDQGAFRNPAGKWRLTVQVDGTRETVTGYESAATYNDPVTDVRDFDALTISALFSYIDHALQEVEEAAASGNQDRSFTPYVFGATFHPELGYPMSYSGVPSVYVPDAQFAIEVEALTVLQRISVPGMPSTGHLEQ